MTFTPEGIQHLQSMHIEHFTGFMREQVKAGEFTEAQAEAAVLLFKESDALQQLVACDIATVTIQLAGMEGQQ